MRGVSSQKTKWTSCFAKIATCNSCPCIHFLDIRILWWILLCRFLADRFVEGTCPICAYQVGIYH